jgi:polyferredoxin
MIFDRIEGRAPLKIKKEDVNKFISYFIIMNIFSPFAMLMFFLIIMAPFIVLGISLEIQLNNVARSLLYSLTLTFMGSAFYAALTPFMHMQRIVKRVHNRILKKAFKKLLGMK